MRLELEPSPSRAVSYLEALRSGLDAILCWEVGYDAGWVFQEVLNGRLRYFHCIESGKPAGFLLALVDRRRPAHPVFYVWGLAVDGAAKWHADLAREIERESRDTGCLEIRARSPRPGWARWAKKFGWAQGATEYVKEV